MSRTIVACLGAMLGACVFLACSEEPARPQGSGGSEAAPAATPAVNTAITPAGTSTPTTEPAPATATTDKEPAMPKPQTRPASPVVIIETSLGTMKAELWPDKAPITVKNFLDYVDQGYYDGLIFHRVIKGFMIQGGGFDADMRQKETAEQLKNEARSDTPNDRGTLAMARTSVVDSATSQFFVNHASNDFLNHRNNTPQGFGYAVFGKLTEGLDVLDKIAAVKTATRGGQGDVPVEPVVIKSIRRAK